MKRDDDADDNDGDDKQKMERQFGVDYLLHDVK